MRGLVRRLKREKGVTVTEFAIIAPVLFLLIFAIIEGGRIFSAWLIITNEAREGARYAVVRYRRPDCDYSVMQDVQTIVTNNVGSLLGSDPTKLSVTVQSNCSEPSSVAVIVNYKVDIMTPLVQGLVPNPFPISAVSVMRAE